MQKAGTVRVFRHGNPLLKTPRHDKRRPALPQLRLLSVFLYAFFFTIPESCRWAITSRQ